MPFIIMLVSALATNGSKATNNDKNIFFIICCFFELFIICCFLHYFAVFC